MPSGLTYVYSAPLTIRGPSSLREALWESIGVLKSGSGGRDVKILVFGRSARVVPAALPLAVAPLVTWDAIWARR